MNNSVNFKNPETGEVKKVSLGLSWPAIFFNIFYLLYKKDWEWFSIFFILDMFCVWFLPSDIQNAAIFMVGLIVFIFYNKIKFKELQIRGWILTDNFEEVFRNNQTQKAEKTKERKERQKEAVKQLKESIDRVDSASTLFEKHIRCPKCRSTNIQALGQHRKGFSAGKATAGYLLTGGIGTLAGFAGKNTKKVDMICMNCGKKFRYKGK